VVLCKAYTDLPNQQTRFVPGAQEELLRCLDWAGLRYDEGTVLLYEDLGLQLTEHTHIMTGPGKEGQVGPYVQVRMYDPWYGGTAAHQFSLSLIDKTTTAKRCSNFSNKVMHTIASAQPKD
jgi:hypothetical protein